MRPQVPAAVLDLLCPNGHIIAESMDRRWLWAVLEALRQTPDLPDTLLALSDMLAERLRADCAHHWESSDDGDRCLWCEVPRSKARWFGQQG